MSLTPAFAALADDTRWLILTRVGHNPASASALARDLPVSRQAIVKHLDVLRAAGLTEVRQHGRELVHTARSDRLEHIARDLQGIARDWERSLAQIKQLAEGTP